MRVLLVSPWNTACGIAEFAAYLKEAVRAADPQIEIEVLSDLHPRAVDPLIADYDLVWLNYQSAVLSQWQPEHLQALQARGLKCGATWHDSGVPNSDHCLSIYAVADAFVVHEPCNDLPKAHYWRQGVPARQPPFAVLDEDRPCVGTVGWPFPWKNYPLLLEGARRAGWSCLIIAPGVTAVQIAEWQAINPRTQVFGNFVERTDVVSLLNGCDATAFLYNCHNTGTSGAIRQGIAARKPVIATRFPAGRQFRDLQEDPLGKRVITWIEPTLHAVAETLSRVDVRPIHVGMVHLAERDSWKSVGERYAKLYRSLVQR